MKVDKYRVLSDCVEEGIRYGYNRSFKHTDNPSEDDIVREIENAVMNQICEYFNFDE